MGSVLSVVTLAQLVEAGSPDTEPYSGAESRGQPPAQPWYISVTTPGNSDKQENTFHLLTLISGESCTFLSK